jgi:thiamine pyrophosphate-dependent acetolactate synthase large subunit-like protein
MTTNLTCGQALMQLLEAYGVDTVFGMPGVHTLEYYRGIGTTEMRHVMFRHEQGGGFMADGYARITGKPAVCCVITGPGVTNVATAVGNAYADSQPMLVIASTNAVEDLGAGRGRLHEITDQRATIAPMTAFSQTILNGNSIPSAVARAFEIFANGRPRPVHIEVPIDKIAEAANFAAKASPLADPPEPSHASVERAAALCKGAKRPIIIAGGGVIDHGKEILAVAEKLGAAIVLTTAGKGAVPEHHPLNAGGCLISSLAHTFIGEADLVIAVGTELSETDTWVPGFLPIKGKLIRIDIDPANLSRDLKPDAALLGDGGAAMALLADALPAPAKGRGFGGGQAIADLRKAVVDQALHGDKAKKHAKVLDAIRAALPENGWLVTDATQPGYLGNIYYPTSTPRSYTHPSGYCTLGSALPSALGACLGAPERPGAALVGDAGFLFTVQELATGVDEGISLPIVLWNNDGLGQIRDDMISKDIKPIGVSPRNPDYLALAKAFGAEAVEPDSLDGLEASIADGFTAGRPVLIQVREDAAYLS